MLVTLWSPKGGSGTSVVAAAFASVLARHHRGVRLVDLAGDQPVVCAVRVHDKDRGGGDWLVAGPTVPADAIDAFALDTPGGFALVPVGTADPAVASAEAGAALAVVLRDDQRITVVDAGLARAPASEPIVELADLSMLVTRACFLALRRAQARATLVGATSGVLLVDEPHRSLGRDDIAALVGRPVLGVVPCAPDVARTVDAGLLLQRAPFQLFRALAATVRRLGLDGCPERAA